MADMTNPMSDAEKLAQVMSGNLQGTLSSGDRLVALSQLMRSLTRSGRAAGLTPGGVVQNIQQQKAAELQNQLQIEQLRQQFTQEAELRAARKDYIEKLTTEEEKRDARLLPLSAFADLAKKRLESRYDFASAIGKEYQDRLRLQGKDKADAWLALQGEKLIPVPEGGAVYRGSDFVAGPPAPAGVTFTPVNTTGTQGGPAPQAPGGFRGR